MNDLVPANGGNDQLTQLLLRAATDPNFSPQNFEVAMKFISEREAQISHRAFNRAMAMAQSELELVPRTGKNDHLRARYATLDGMLAVILPVASAHGLSVRFGSQLAAEPLLKCVTCTISHEDGHSETTALEGPVVVTGSQGGRMQMTSIQAVGSTVTYLKRYLLGMVFALVLSDEQDDDGSGGDKGDGKPTPPSRPPYQTDQRRAPAAPTGGNDAPPADPPANGTAGAQAAPRPRDDAAWLKRLGERLAKLGTADAINALMNIAEIAAWRAEASEAVRRDIDAMVEARGRELSPETGLSNQALALIAMIEATTDILALDALPIDPSFGPALTLLPFAEQDAVDSVFKARAAHLSGGQT